MFHDVPGEQQAEIQAEWANVSRWFSEVHGLDEPQFYIHLGSSYETVRHLLNEGHDADACQWNSPGSSVLLLSCDQRQSFPVLFIAWTGIGGRAHVIENDHRLLGPWWLDSSMYDYLNSAYAARNGGSLEAERNRRQLAVGGVQQSLQELETANAWYGDHATASNLGWLGVDWLVQLAGDASFVEYMTGRGRHRHWGDAFEAVFGLTPERFYKYFALDRPLPRRVVTGATETEASASPRQGLWVTTVLHPGLNAIGWVEAAMPTASLFESIPEAVAMFAWDGAEQKWQFARRGDTTTGNLELLHPGVGVLVRVASEAPIAWIRRVTPVQPDFLSGTVELHPGWNLVAWAGQSNSPNVLRGDIRDSWRWDQRIQGWRSRSPSTSKGDFSSDFLAHGEALWVDSAQAGLWRQTPTGWWPESEALPDWIASIQFWGNVAAADQQALADRAADVSHYFSEWFAVSTAPRVHIAADDATAAEMYREVRGTDDVYCGNAGPNEFQLNLSCFDSVQQLASAVST